MAPCGILSLRLREPRSMRPARNGAVPPAWDQMKRMSEYFAAWPLHIRLMMARVVSVPYSMVPADMPGMRFLQQLAAVGWTGTTALRRCRPPITRPRGGVPGPGLRKPALEMG